MAMVQGGSMYGGEKGREDSYSAMREVLGPFSVDQAIRQAISVSWMMLPKENRSVAAVEKDIRRIVDRALRNLKEDSQAYGIPDDKS